MVFRPHASSGSSGRTPHRYSQCTDPSAYGGRFDRAWP
jgi:hypothetical protein